MPDYLYFDFFQAKSLENHRIGKSVSEMNNRSFSDRTFHTINIHDLIDGVSSWKVENQGLKKNKKYGSMRNIMLSTHTVLMILMFIQALQHVEKQSSPVWHTKYVDYSCEDRNYSIIV